MRDGTPMTARPPSGLASGRPCFGADVDGNGNAQTRRTDITTVPGPAPDVPAPDESATAKPPGWIKRHREQVEGKYYELRDTVESRRGSSTPIGVAFDA